MLLYLIPNPQADHPQLVSDILDIVGNSVTVAPIELHETAADSAAAAAAAAAADATAAAAAAAAAAVAGPVIHQQASELTPLGKRRFFRVCYLLCVQTPVGGSMTISLLLFFEVVVSGRLVSRLSKSCS